MTKVDWLSPESQEGLAQLQEQWQSTQAAAITDIVPFGCDLRLNLRAEGDGSIAIMHIRHTTLTDRQNDGHPSHVWKINGAWESARGLKRREVTLAGLPSSTIPPNLEGVTWPQERQPDTLFLGEPVEMGFFRSETPPIRFGGIIGLSFVQHDLRKRIW